MPVERLSDVISRIFSEPFTAHWRLSEILQNYLQRHPLSAVEALLNRYEAGPMDEKILRYCDDEHTVSPITLMERIKNEDSDFFIHLCQTIKEEPALSETENLENPGDLLYVLGFSPPIELRGGLRDLLNRIQRKRQAIDRNEPTVVTDSSIYILSLVKTILLTFLTFYAEYAYGPAWMKQRRLKSAGRGITQNLLSFQKLVLMFDTFQKEIENNDEMRARFQQLGSHLFPSEKLSLLPLDVHTALLETSQELERALSAREKVTREWFGALSDLISRLCEKTVILQTVPEDNRPELILIRSVVENESHQCGVYYSSESAGSEVIKRVRADSSFLLTRGVTPGCRALFYSVDSILYPAPDFLLQRMNGRAVMNLDLDEDSKRIRTKLESFHKAQQRKPMQDYDPEYNQLFEYLRKFSKNRINNRKTLKDFLERRRIDDTETHFIEFKASLLRNSVFQQETIATEAAAFANTASVSPTRTGGVIVIGIPNNPDDQGDQKIAAEMRSVLGKTPEENDVLKRILRTIAGVNEGKHFCVPKVIAEHFLIPAKELNQGEGWLLFLAIPSQRIEEGPVRVAGKFYDRVEDRCRTIADAAVEAWKEHWKTDHDRNWKRRKGGVM